MREKIFGSGKGHPADTPANGDFARYVEDLVARQAKSLAGGQQMTQVVRQPATTSAVSAASAASRHAAAPVQQPTRAQTRAAELRQAPPGMSPKVSTTARTGTPESWETLQQVLHEEDSTTRSGRFRIPPFLIFMVVIVLFGAASQFDFNWAWPLFILVWVLILSRIVRSVVGALGGKKPGAPLQRK